MVGLGQFRRHAGKAQVPISDVAELVQQQKIQGALRERGGDQFSRRTSRQAGGIGHRIDDACRGRCNPNRTDVQLALQRRVTDMRRESWQRKQAPEHIRDADDYSSPA
jgi:hypothetical protein